MMNVKRQFFSGIMLFSIGLALLAIFHPTVIEHQELLDNYYKEGFPPAKVVMTIVMIAGTSVGFGLLLFDVHRRKMLTA